MSDELAQLVETLQAQQQRLVFTSFTNADAWNIGSWAVRTATERGLAVVFDIRRGDQQLFHAALDGTNPDNDTWIERKNRSVRRFGMPSYLLGRLFALHHGDFNEATRLPYADYVAAGGSYPITVKNVGIIGTITASGLTEEQDHDFVVEAIEHHLASQSL
jgi:uncharacterized protein (UPF0303 family)